PASTAISATATHASERRLLPERRRPVAAGLATTRSRSRCRTSRRNQVAAGRGEACRIRRRRPRELRGGGHATTTAARPRHDATAQPVTPHHPFAATRADPLP